MRPLIDAGDVRRFIEPRASQSLLFPYEIDNGKPRLIPFPELLTKYPKAAGYLGRFEAELRLINESAPEAQDWHRYTYPKNLSRQHKPKIVVAQLVPNLRLAFDAAGNNYLDNVRVNGILPRDRNGWFLLGSLNAPVANYVFRWLGKPKANGYFEANKQFIAPLPIPRASLAERAGLSALAKQLQARRTAQVDEEAELEERLAKTARANWPLDRILPDVRSIAAIEADMPRSVRAPDRERWIDEERQADEEAALARIGGMLRLDSEFAVTLANGKRSFLIDDREAAYCFVGAAEGPLVEAQWRAVAISFTPTGKDDAARLVGRLRRVATEAAPAVAEQIIAIGRRLAERALVIRHDEKQLHDMTCALFKLTPEEKRLVERGRI